MTKKQMIALALSLSTLTASSALAAAPTSQFGFSGWPYRQSTSCGSIASGSCGATSCPTSEPSACPTLCPTAAPDVTVEATQAPCITNCPETQTPTIEPTVIPTAMPTQAPTVKPTATTAPTPKPTPQATVKPTEKPAPTPTSPSTGGDYTTVVPTAQEEIALSLLNADRARNGLPALAMDPELSRLARMKSCDMNANHYFAHQSPTLGNAATMLRNNGYAFVSVGENIAHHATVEKSQAAFMSSTGHRTNILGSQWKKVGIGVCYDAQGYVYVTQLFVR